MWLRAFLAANALLWIPYGLLCFVSPSYLADAAGVSAVSATGTIELRAMYGGLQVAIGVLAGAAFVRESLVRPALVALAFLCSGLFTARLLGALVQADVSAYTAAGLLFEILLASLSVRLLALGGAADA